MPQASASVWTRNVSKKMIFFSRYYFIRKLCNSFNIFDPLSVNYKVFMYYLQELSKWKTSFTHTQSSFIVSHFYKLFEYLVFVYKAAEDLEQNINSLHEGWYWILV